MPIRPSSVGVNFSLKRLISQKWPDNFLGFFRKVPIYCKHMDLVDFYRSERSNLAHFSLGGNFLKHDFITFSLFWHEAFQWGYWWTAERWIWLNHSKGNFDRYEKSQIRIDTFSLFCVYSFVGMIIWSTVKRWIWFNYEKLKDIFKFGKVRFLSYFPIIINIIQ